MQPSALAPVQQQAKAFSSQQRLAWAEADGLLLRFINQKPRGKVKTFLLELQLFRYYAGLTDYCSPQVPFFSGDQA
ncbi:hypothetical protein [Prochlorococcus sp.P1363]|uniref:hypothetical protein n=1 Tax=unclassified Prochlorococcus TaxID=2627481 RepID=UPI00145E8F05|nr:hypothetical protein [Prochlorococcus sp.P1363]NMP13025.1 hypothetical protein [Prochlorococcus sp.P1363]